MYQNYQGLGPDEKKYLNQLFQEAGTEDWNMPEMETSKPQKHWGNKRPSLPQSAKSSGR